jgi:Domain of unknown function (DUF4386)
MKSAKSTGRIIGILLIVHLLTGLLTPYIMLRPLTSPFTFAANAAGKEFLVRSAVMMLFVGGAVTIAIAITSLPFVRQYSLAMATWLFALAVTNFCLQCVENATWMSLFTFSRDYASASATDVGMYTVVGAAVRSAWKWVHYTHLLVMVSWMLMLFVALWRTRLAPRVLGVLGLITTLMQITGITLPQFLVYPSPVPMLMGMPLGFVYLALALWLIVKGFRAAPQRTEAAEV